MWLQDDPSLVNTPAVNHGQPRSLPSGTGSLKSKVQGGAGSRGCAHFEGGSENKNKGIPGGCFGRRKGNLDDFVRYWNRLQGGRPTASFPGHL